MENTFSFFALLFRQKYIKRWNLMRNFREENLSEHSAECAVLAHCLAVIGNEIFKRSYNVDHIAVLALFHDVPEVITGDLPTPVKYFNSDMRNTYKKIEKSAADMLLSKLPAPLFPVYSALVENDGEYPEEGRLVKAADKLCAYIKCIEEEKSGNTEFRKAKTALTDVLTAMQCPELDWFMENLLPSFLLTLDEM